MNPQVDQYFVEGCMRCDLGGTAQCKVHSWQEPMQYLRQLLNNTELKEDYKWSQPCYTLNGKNVLILTAFKNYCCLAFFKGTLMKDPLGVMKSPGKNSQAARQLRFTTLDEVKAQESYIRSCIEEAIALEKSGAKVDFKQKKELEYPEELNEILNSNTQLKQAFESLTPGRQRGYVLYFESAKQSKTRVARIEKYIPKILAGKGFHDR